MGAITARLRELKDRVAKRSKKSGTAGERALKRRTAKARRLEHERLDNKFPR